MDFTQHLRFAVPEDLSPESLRERLEEHLTTDGDPVADQLAFLDSFDWRLHNAGLELTVRRQGDERTLSLSGPGPVSAPWKRKTLPGFADDIRTAGIRDRIAPLLEMRTLLVQAHVHRHITPFKRLDSELKTTVRVYLEDRTVEHPDTGVMLPVGSSLVVVPLKGYEADAADLTGRLIEDLGLEEGKASPLGQALAAFDRRPGDYSSKLDLSLDPEQSASAAARYIFRTLLEVMARNEDGLMRDLDSEFLHDFRVAVRRTRSALSQMKAVVPEPLLAKMKDDFRWLGQVTGPTRDLDVYLLAFEDYQADLPPQMAQDLVPLRQFLKTTQRREHKALVRALGSRRYRSLVDTWGQWLTDDDAVANAGDLTIKALADARIWKVYRALLAEGRAITPESPADALHELRKTCKKLRYLLEFFESLYPPGEVRDLIKSLKAFQQLLGDHQDCEVQAETLLDLGERLQATAGPARTRTVMAMGALAARLYHQQNQLRGQFSDRFDSFQAKAVRRKFAALFQPSKGGAK